MQIFAKEQLKNIPEVQTKSLSAMFAVCTGTVRRRTLMNPMAEICAKNTLAHWQ